MTNLLCLIITWGFKKIFLRTQKIIESEKDEKTTILRIISHDISSPLTSLTISLNQIAKTKENSTYHDRALKSLNAVNDIIRDLKEYEFSKSGKKKARMALTTWGQVFDELIFLTNPLADAKKIKLVMPDNLTSEYLVTDQKMLVYQILSNILTNAIKFTHEGKEIQISLSKLENSFIIIIKDQGVGIPKNILENIFSTFKETTRIGTMGEKGTGFGMPIVKTSIELLGGTITVTSKTIDDDPIEHGTTMTLHLPSGM